jgi:hypothetical protein
MNEIQELVCQDCKGLERGCDGDHCDEYQIVSLCVELFGETFLERWDGVLPKKTSGLLSGLKGLKMINDLFLTLCIGEIK